MGRLVKRAKLELVLVGILLRVELDGGNVISMKRLKGSADVYSIRVARVLDLLLGDGARDLLRREASREDQCFLSSWSTFAF
ncbi:uncharacterized protein RAG0_07876 [Rhynchosporium agropyri]|uniref:Uncharacterized protein n=1 Tax=Rhynchosporium agropyri TaxID=914238 RepID=A0A1E1KNA7_9HELO|nr:uncharacterized protein RAG0_07876 [Rhynchosporium agropyri]